MVYPLISEYTEAILSAEDNFNELSYLRPVLDDSGNPIMSSGNFAVVYKMEDVNTGKYHAVKCFTRDQENRNKRYKNICSTLSEEESIYLTTFSFHEAELFVDSSQTDETEFPVLLMDWVDGKPLDKFIEEYSGNPFVLYELCYNFRQMAKWLVSKSFAHGDLKPDNILVQEDARIVLIDYDGMYVWSREKQDAPEGGTPEYRNPFHHTPYNEHMDDFALAVLALSLNLISISYDIQNKFNRGNGLLFSLEDIKDINKSEIFIFLRELLISEPLLGQYYATFIKSLSGNTLIESDFDFKNEREIDNLLLFNPVIGETADNGIIYSSDGRFVIGYDNGVPYDEDLEDNYIYIKEGTIGIVENAFDYKTPKLKLFFPSTLRYFSSKSINYRYKRINWNSPWYSYKDGYILTKDLSEAILKHLVDANFPIQTKIIGMGLFENLSFDCKWPVNIIRIRKDAFRNTQGIGYLRIPDSIIEIGYRAFQSCSASEVTFPKFLKTLEKWCFQLCKNLEIIDFRNNDKLKIIPENAFCNCKILKLIDFPRNLTTIENSAFLWCYSIENLNFPESLQFIGKEAFSMKKFMSDKTEPILKNLTFNGPLKKIDENAFTNIESLEEIHFKSDVDDIGKDSFKGCINLKSVTYTKINRISLGAFHSCKALELEINDNITEIEPGALTGSKVSLLNKNFEIIDSGLYSKSTYCKNPKTYEKYFKSKELIYYWGTNPILELPEGIINIYKEAFLNLPSTIILPKSYLEKNLNNATFVDIVIVPHYFKERGYLGNSLISEEPLYIDKFGVFYSSDKKTLKRFPMDLDLEVYEIEPECEEIANFAFENDVDPDPEFGVSYYGNKLKRLIFPPNLIKLGDYALAGCRELIELELPSSLKSIEEAALVDCISIRSITLPSSLEYLGKNALPPYLNHLKSNSAKFKIINDCLLSEDDELLWMPFNIEKLDLPELIIYKNENCYTTKNSIITTKGKLLWTIPEIPTYNFPFGINAIGDGAFRRNQTISKLIIPYGVITIENGAFGYNQRLFDIYLPSSITKIEDLHTRQGWGRKYITSFYPDRIHIPQGRKKYFKQLLSGIRDEQLIEDYDEFDPEFI